MKAFGLMLRNQLVVVLLSALFLVEVGSLVFANPSEVTPTAAPLRISEIDGPRIDPVAATTVLGEQAGLPGTLWVFLLFVYGALLVFNFSYTFETVRTPQWFWETLYTFLALLGWYLLDPTGSVLWFPFMIIKTGLIMFTLYVYLLERRPAPMEETPKTEPLF